MENQTTTPKLEKKLKRKHFDLFDAGYACVCFIILQLICSLLISMFRREIIFNPSLYFIAQFTVEAVFIFASLIVSASRNVEFVKATTYNKGFSWKTALLAVAISAVCMFGFSSLTNVFVYSLQKLGYTSSLGSININSFGMYIFFVILMCVVPAVFEETLFRATILNGMREKGKTYAIFMSALIFMLMHGGPDQTIHQFILGIVLGYVFVYSGSIWVTVLIHFLNNFYAVTALYIMNITSMNGSATETAEELPSWGSLAVTLVVGLAIASVAAYIIYLCVVGMNKVRKSEEQKKHEKFDALLEKETLTAQDIAWIKKYEADKNEYALYDKAEEERKALKAQNLKPIQIAGEVQTGQNGETIAETTCSVSGKQKKKVNVGYVITLTISLVYLCATWLLTLISGFLG